MTGAQPPLGLVAPTRRALGREAFIDAPANAAAVARITAPAGWPDGRLALVGPEGSGKTHLVHVLMAETGAVRIEATALRAAMVPSLVAARTVALEDVDRLAAAPHCAEAERAAFHLLNLAGAEGARVLLTGRTAPARWAVALPDLGSRLAALDVVRLAPPDAPLLAAVIRKLLDDRHLRHEEALPAFVASRIERSFAAARTAVDRLDAASLAERRNLTKRFAGVLFPLRPDDMSPLDRATQTRHE